MKSQKIHKKRRSKATLSLEPLFRDVKEALLHDLGMTSLFPGDLRSREPEHPSFVGCDPYLFKRFKQALDFDKRIIWSCDRSFEKLSIEALDGFKNSQQTFLLPEPLSQRGFHVIQKARELCTDILGAFSYSDWFDSCSFGKRAAVGLPQRKSYLDTRFERISGSSIQWAAFNECLARDLHLLRAVRKRSTERKLVDEIKATLVPKSFKAARVIAPDTILGGFLSRGLGDMIRKRLEKGTRIDLSKQQDRHRRWARNASKHGRNSTIDMSKASDSFTWRHIELIVPEDWHHALDCVRTRRCNVDGDVINLRSYMLMGSGHTFPLQTLLFYCLVEATRLLLKQRGLVSVYGDDIIVPTSIVQPLIVVFEELGFVINSEKSFFDEPDALRPHHTFFRESCGGDYKGGLDVRPYMPECDLQREGKVSSNHLVAWCHKVINGLLDHWDPCELPLTLAYLLTKVNSTKKRICFVPAWETDHAGIRHYIPPYHLIGRECSYITYEDSHPSYFRLVYELKKRKRQDEERPYLWYSYWLQQFTAVDSNDPLCQPGVPYFLELSNRWMPYSSPVELSGEPRKGVKGAFRWKKQGPKRYE